MKQKLFGFTLIEMMIVVAILGILAAIAYPSYVRHVQRSHRADAQAALMENAQFLERRFTACNAYNRDPTSDPRCSITTSASALPRPSTDRYDIDFDGTPTATSFKLKATPDHAGQTNDSCGTLTLEHTGARSPTGTGADCW